MSEARQALSFAAVGFSSENAWADIAGGGWQPRPQWKNVDKPSCIRHEAADSSEPAPEPEPRPNPFGERLNEAVVSEDE